MMDKIFNWEQWRIIAVSALSPVLAFLTPTKGFIFALEVQERAGRTAAIPDHLGNHLFDHAELRRRHRLAHRDEIIDLRLHVRLRAERLPKPHTRLPHQQGPAHHLPRDTIRVQTRPARKRAAHRRARRTRTR